MISAALQHDVGWLGPRRERDTHMMARVQGPGVHIPRGHGPGLSEGQVLLLLGGWHESQGDGTGHPPRGQQSRPLEL